MTCIAGDNLLLNVTDVVRALASQAIPVDFRLASIKGIDVQVLQGLIPLLLYFYALHITYEKEIFLLIFFYIIAPESNYLCEVYVLYSVIPSKKPKGIFKLIHIHFVQNFICVRTVHLLFSSHLLGYLELDLC